MAPPHLLRTKLNRFGALLVRHWEAFVFVLTTVIPLIVRNRRRPVIFSRYSGMGDIICTIPAVRELMKRHPGAIFIYNCHPDFAAVPLLAGVADRITSLEPVGVIGHFYRFLLAGFYHFAHGDDEPDKVAQEPMITEFCRQFHVPVTDQHPELSVNSSVLDRVKGLLTKRSLDLTALILIHPGPSWAVKEWPRKSWTQLVAELRARGHTSIAQLGVGRLNPSQASVGNIPGAVSLVDAFSIEECIAVISLARLFIGIDSGLLHLAASQRTPSVGIFGPTAPQFYYPPDFRRDFVRTDVECAGCEHRKPRIHWLSGCPFDIRCMPSIEVHEVLQRCLSKLDPVEHHPA